MADVSPWVQIVGTALGGALSIGGGFVAQWMTTGRDREARQVAAEEQRKRQRAEFQMKSLLEVQEAAFDVFLGGRLFPRSYYAKVLEAGQRADFPNQIDAAEAFNKGITRIIVLAERIEDDQIRCLLRTLRDQVIQSSGSKREPAEAEAAYAALFNTFEETNARIGKVLRSLL